MSAQSEARAAGWTREGAGEWFNARMNLWVERKLDEWFVYKPWPGGRISGPYRTMREAMRALEGAAHHGRTA